jgi:glucokinase
MCDARRRPACRPGGGGAPPTWPACRRRAGRDRPGAAALCRGHRGGGDRVASPTAPGLLAAPPAVTELGLEQLRCSTTSRRWPCRCRACGRRISALPRCAARGRGNAGRDRAGHRPGRAGVVTRRPAAGSRCPVRAGIPRWLPADDFESELLRRCVRVHEHVSAERLLSGIGLPVLHRGSGGVDGRPPPPPSSAEQIVGAGVADADARAAAPWTFCALLGGFAGNVALTLGARGGVYIGGGIVPRMGDRFFASSFRDRFEAKGRFPLSGTACRPPHHRHAGRAGGRRCSFSTKLGRLAAVIVAAAQRFRG